MAKLCRHMQLKASCLVAGFADMAHFAWAQGILALALQACRPLHPHRLRLRCLMSNDALYLAISLAFAACRAEEAAASCGGPSLDLASFLFQLLFYIILNVSVPH